MADSVAVRSLQPANTKLPYTSQKPEAQTPKEIEALLEKKGFRSGDRVVLYDGVCNFCNGWVRFVANRNSEQRFKFAALQGETGRALLRKYGRDPNDLDTLVLVDSDSKVYTRTDAALRVLSHVGGPLGMLSTVVRKTVPRLVRDFVYSKIIAPNRHRIMGKSDRCIPPPPKLRQRFLD